MNEDSNRGSQSGASKRRSSVKERWGKLRASVFTPADVQAIKNSRVNISQTDIDPELLKVQIEWADLAMHDDIQVYNPLKCGDLTKDELSIVAASWFNDGVLGWKIDYPQNETQLKCYIFTRSRRFLQIYTCFFFLHILTPFLGMPNCGWSDVANNRSVDLWNTEEGRYLSQFVINFLALVCVVIYCFEIFMRLYVNNSVTGSHTNTVLPWYKDSWIFIRLVCCLFLLADILLFICTKRPVRFGRALLPFIYISRRNSLRQMFHGLWTAFTNSFGILSFLVAVVLLWTFGGYVLFRGVDVTKYSDIYENLYVNITAAQQQHQNRFDTPPQSFLTSLFAATSRSYNILVLNPYFQVTPASTVFFMSLTIIADLIIINLMIAFGNRQYRIFAEKLFKRQLRNRRQAFVSIHSILADSAGNISRETWLEFCGNCQGKYSVEKKMADTIFTLECESDPLKASYDTIDLLGLFRLSALLSNRVKMDLDKVQQEEDKTRIDSSNLLSGLFEKSDLPSIPPAPSSSSSLPPSTNPMHHHPSDSSIDIDIDHRPLQRESSPSESRPPSERPSSRIVAGPPAKRSTLSMLFLAVGPEDEDSDDERNAESSKKRAAEDEKLWASRQGQGEKSNVGIDEIRGATSSLVTRATLYARLQAIRLTRWTVAVDTPPVPYFWPHPESFAIEPFSLVNVVVKVLLVVQCGVISSAGSDTKGWVVVGWIIMLFLWLEMLVKRLAWGQRLYLRRTGFGFTAVLNVVTTVLMVFLGTDNINYGSPEFILYMILQSSRLLLLFRYLADSDAFRSLFPLVYRIFFIIFCIFYSFSVIGHNRLCNAFRESNIEDDAVDDANTWLNFQKMFNFDSLLHTMYTCFYVSTLGNWTWIMNAAAQTEPVVALLFFTSIRIVFTVAIYPILFSFLITAYINRRNKDEKAKGSKSDDLKGLENEMLEFNEAGSVLKEFKFEKQLRQTDSPGDVKRALHRAVLAVYQKRYKFGSVLLERDSRAPSESSELEERNLSISAASDFSRSSSDNFDVGTGMTAASHRGDTKKIKSVTKLWMSHDKLSTTEMFDSYSNGSLLMGDPEVDPGGAAPAPPPPVGSGSAMPPSPTGMGKGKADAALKSTKTHESMMSHWSGGQEALTPGEKAKKKEAILKKLLQSTMESIAAEREDILGMQAEAAFLRRMHP